jgi:DNA-binding GntR family transcriptional regulator
MTGGPAPAVQRSSLREQIAEALRDEMLTGRLPGGGQFTVKEIAELYGVSATPVREALVDLAAQGLVEVEHHRGFQVRKFTWSDYTDIVEARTLVVEGLFRRVSTRAMQGVQEGELASVRRRAEAATRAALAGELDVLVGCDLRFWRELSGLAGNAHVCDFLHRLRIQAWMFGVPYLRGQPNLADLFWHGHVALVEAIGAADLENSQQIIDRCNAWYLEVMGRLAKP